MLKLSQKMNNPILGYNAALFLNNHEQQQNILRDCGLDALAELANEASNG